MTKLAPSKGITIILGIVVLAIVLVIAFANFLKPSPEPISASVATELSTGAQDNTEKAGTVAAIWQWQTLADPAEEPEPQNNMNAIPFSADALYEALQNVRIDENGDVILDNEALEALNRTLQFGEVGLNSQNLADLQELIKVGVPGKTGEQTAKIVVDYYRYLEAEDEFNTLYEHQGSQADVSNDTYAQQYEELKALRALYLGQDVAAELFATADASARYMFEAQQLEADPTLSADDKAERLKTLNDQLTDATVPVDNWRQRYSTFITEKQRIIEAGLADPEKKVQIERLMQQHFNSDELAKVQYLQLDSF
jgi:hypothetical protein